MATEPPQQVALGPWDGSGCELHAPARSESTSRVAFLACPRGPGPARESLLIAFVDARAAELWAVAADNSLFGRARKLGRLALPRDRVLDVRMIEDAAP
ncbi:MAG: hypothetical protein HY908_25465 [Myxococcales bacterium]|nr:hypothetical protein [Myxococcales bacterium]